MRKNILGRTGLEVSQLTLGCGAVGGLMTKGRASDQDNAIAWARDNGINFFDTAASYGDGASEENLGRALGGNVDGLVISTKVGLKAEHMQDVAGEVQRSIDASLARLKLDHVDLLQLHNTIGLPDRHGTLDAGQMLEELVPAFDKIRSSGKAQYFGFTAKGSPDLLHKWVASGAFDSAQIFYNLLVPSAGETIPDNYPSVDYDLLLDAAKQHGVGSIGVRVLAGGTLSGSEKRHPLGITVVAPIGASADANYASDVKLGHSFVPLIEKGFADSVPELAMRYSISHPHMCTTEIGVATIDELQQAVTAVNRGPLEQQALTEIKEIQAGFCV